MVLFETIRIGFDQLRSHKLRAALSILGILISVGSVVGIVSIGDGLRTVVTEQFERSGGPSIISVIPPDTWYRNNVGRWVRRDWEEYLENDDVRMISRSSEYISFVVPLVNDNREVRHLDVTTNARIIASNEYFMQTENWSVDNGRFITAADISNASKVAVIGNELSKELYGDRTPVGQEVKIGGARYQVIGKLAPYRMFDDTNARNVVVPLTTSQKRVYGNNRIHRLTVMASEPMHVDEVAGRIRAVLKNTHLHGDEFKVETAESQIQSFNRVVTILKIVAGGIAGISLLVGGIGIMNIMLVSVTERTREIGIRMALGARRRSILVQFMLESMVLCLFGGALGILLGLALGQGIAAYIRSITYDQFTSVVTTGLMTFAVMYSALIGLFFGVYPAWRASRLDPVEALRHET